MTTTVLFIGTFASALVAQIAVSALFLQLGSRWAKIPNVGFLRAFGALAVAAMVSTPWLLLDNVPAGGLVRTVLVDLMQIVLPLGLTWIVLARFLRTSIWRAIMAWLVTLIPGAGFALLLALLVVRPYLFEAFKMPTNAMAPTILGRHWESPCPRCGSPAF